MWFSKNTYCAWNLLSFLHLYLMLTLNLQKYLAIISSIFCSTLYSFITSNYTCATPLKSHKLQMFYFFQTIFIFYFSLDNFCSSIFKFTKLFICSVNLFVNLIQWILKLKYSIFHLVVELYWFFLKYARFSPNLLF